MTEYFSAFYFEKVKQYIHFGGRAAFHDECELLRARCFLSAAENAAPLDREGNT